MISKMSQRDASDFLIRGIIGMDPKGGAIAVGETVGVGKRIRFMVISAFVKFPLCMSLFSYKAARQHRSA